MAAVAAAPGLPTRLNSASEVPQLSEPRSPPPGNQWSNGTSTPHHPELNSEVAALSDKLIKSINVQTSLEDTLAATRHELEEARERIQQLEAEAQLHRENVTSGVMVKKSDAKEDLVLVTSQLAEEKTLRSKAEKEKRNMEQELENLTASLFEEANKMVAEAREAREVAERKNEQLRSQVKDTEMLLVSHQEQLTELKTVMQQMSPDREEIEAHTNGSTTPSSPAAQNIDNMNKIFEALNLTPNTPGAGDICPAHSTSFTHLMKPVCRTDLAAYDDFHSLLQSAQKSAPPSRVTSGSYAGLNVMGLGKLSEHAPFNHATANGSNSSLSTTHSSSPATPHLPGSTNGNTARDPYIPLKETRFYKRVVTEDIEPTLRLDLAPGVSWLTRRTVLTAICEGGLVVEPMPASTRIYVFSCAMCGEHRRGDQYLRTHRFRTSDSENAQRYPLCKSCLDKVRACCDFVGYLRMIKDGHIRIHDQEEEMEAWEESVRLRERMFWCRIGGGVVPAFVQLVGSPDLEKNKKSLEWRGSVDEIGDGAGKAGNEEAVAVNGVDPFQSDEKRASIGKTVIEKESEGEGEEPSTNGHADAAESSGDDADKQLQSSLRDSVNGGHSANGSRSQSRNNERLSLTIPGTFN